MKYVKEVGWWMPDPEEHLQEWMLTVNRQVENRLTYQRHKYEAALDVCNRRGVAVDIGAHVGLWSWQMARDFNQVIAFEPVPAHRECWYENMKGIEHASLEPYALGERDDYVMLQTQVANSTGGTGVEPNATEGIRADVIRLDDYTPLDSSGLDFLKIDCEGYELFVLRGAVETIKKYKPTVIAEQKPETGMEERYKIGTTDGVEFLKSLGMKVHKVIQGDWILTW